MPRRKKTPKQYVPNDKYFYKAQEEGYRARSAYKLIEIQERFEVFKKGDEVLDLGAFPGSFMQVVHRMTDGESTIIGMDLERMKPFKKKPNMFIYQGDVFNNVDVGEALKKAGSTGVDVIISDLAPKTTGIHDIDQFESVQLNLQVLEASKIWLKYGGNLLMKVFQGEELDELLHATKELFETITVHKPKACRRRSFETYILAKNKKM